MLLIHRTFETVTPESAEEGEAASHGYIALDEPVTFRELVRMLKGGEPSCMPAHGDVRTWVTHYDCAQGRAYFEKGETRNESVFYSVNNPQRNAKYWRLAFRVAGLTR